MRADERIYELMIIFDRDAESETTDEILGLLTDTVKDSGGELLNTDRWGMRTFAYEIDHKTEGYYVVLEFQLPPEATESITRPLSLSDYVVRFKMILLPEEEAVRRHGPDSEKSLESQPSTAPPSFSDFNKARSGDMPRSPEKHTAENAPSAEDMPASQTMTSEAPSAADPASENTTSSSDPSAADDLTFSAAPTDPAEAVPEENSPENLSADPAFRE